MSTDPHNKAWRHFLRHLKAVRLPFAVSFVLLLLAAGLTAGKAWLIQPIVDGFLKGDPTREQLLLVCGLVAGIFLTQAALVWGYTIVVNVATGRVVHEIRRELFEQLMGQSLSFFVRHPSGELTSRVVNDVAGFQSAAIASLQVIARDTFTILLLLGLMLFQEWRLALLTLALLTVVAIVLKVVQKRVRDAGRRVQDSLGQITRQLGEIIGGTEVILGFGVGPRWSTRFDRTNEEHYDAHLRASHATALSIGLTQGIIGAGLAGLLFVTGAALLRREITEGQFFFFLAAIYLMQGPALSIGSSTVALSRGMAALGRAIELFDETPTVLEPERPLPFDAPEGRISIREVTFAYGETRILDRVSFDVEAGELVVLVGDSGAGKSTIAKLLLRLYDPDEGEVRIDDVDLRNVARADLYQAVSHVGQDIFLFDDTLEANIKIGKPEASDEEVQDAIRLACLEDVIAEIPGGLAAPVGERGVQLSGGQRQRVAIARALLTDARILVLDEATSALDVDLERRILERLAELRTRRTIFAITHRPSLAEIADRVLRLQKGSLEAQIGAGAS